MAKIYWVHPCNLSTEKELEEYVRKSNNEVRDNLDKVIKLSDLKEEIEKLEKKDRGFDSENLTEFYDKDWKQFKKRLRIE